MGSATTDEVARAPITAALRNVGLFVGYLATLAQLARAYGMVDGLSEWLWYAGLGAVYLLLFTLMVVRPPARPWRSHGVLAIQCVIVLTLLWFDPQLDFMTALFVPLAFAAALLFRDRTIWYWGAALAALTAGSLMLYLGPLRGLALALVPMAAEIVFAAYVVVAREIEAARRQSQVMLEELETTHARLQEFAAQAGELAAVDERDRVARDLNESVARAVTGILEAARATRTVLAGAEGGADAGAQTEAAAPMLTALQAETQQALAQMRGLIAELRPKSA